MKHQFFIQLVQSQQSGHQIRQCFSVSKNYRIRLLFLQLDIYQRKMQSAQTKHAMIRKILNQLLLQNIKVTSQQLFRSFWLKIIDQKAITQSLEAAIPNFIMKQDIANFKRYTQQTLQIINLQSNFINNEASNSNQDEGMHIKKRQLERIPLKQEDIEKGFFWYDSVNVSKNVLFIALSDQNIEKLKLESKQLNGDLRGQQYAFTEKNIYGSALFVTINFGNLPLENYQLALILKSNSLFSNSKSVKKCNELDKKVTYHLAKGVVLVEEVGKRQNLNEFKLKFILKLTEIVFKHIFGNSTSQNQKNKWAELKPWWYLFKKIYTEIELDFDTQKQLFSCITTSNNQYNFLRYYIWLLLAIHQTEFQRLMQSPFFQRLKINPNYIYPEWDDQQQKKLEEGYLKCFLFSTFKNVDVVKFNLMHQGQKFQKELILNLQPKFVEKLLKLVEEKIVQNNAIKISEFIDFYFSVMIDSIGCLKSEQKSIKKREIVVKCFQLLFKKCLKKQQSFLNQKFDFDQSQKCNQLFFKLVYQQQKLDSSKALFWPEVFEAITNINKLFPELAKDIVKAFYMEQKKLIFAIQANFKPILLHIIGMNNKQINEIFVECLFNGIKMRDNIRSFIMNQNQQEISALVIFFLEYCQKHKFFQPFRKDIRNTIQQLNKTKKQRQLDKMIQLLDFVAPQQRQTTNTKQKGNTRPIKEEACMLDSSKETQKQDNAPTLKKIDLYLDKKQSSTNTLQDMMFSRKKPQLKLQQVNKDKTLSQPGVIRQILQRPIRKAQNRTSINLLVAIFSDKAYNILDNKDARHGRRVEAKNLVKKYEDTTLSCFYCQDIELKTLQEQKVTAIADKQELKLATKYLDCGEKYGLYWMEYPDTRVSQLTSLQFSLIYFLSTNFQKQTDLQLMRNWMNFLKKKMPKPNAKTFTQQANKFVAQQQKSTINLCFYYAFVCITNELFSDQSPQKILQNCDISKKFIYLKLKDYNLSFGIANPKEEIAELATFRTIFKCMLKFLKGLNGQISLSLKTIAEFFRKGLEYKKELLGKQLICDVIACQLPKIFAEGDQALTNYCKSKPIISLKELFLIKCFYAKQSQPKAGSHNETTRTKLYFVALFQLLGDKKKKHNKNMYAVDLPLEENAMLQNLLELLTPTHQLHHGENNEEQAGRRPFVFKNGRQFIPFYTAMKKIADTSIFDSIYDLIKKQVNALIANYLKSDNQFAETIKMLLSNHLKPEQELIIENFIEEKSFSALKLYGLLYNFVQCCKNHSKQAQEFSQDEKGVSQAKDYIRTIAIKLIKRNPEKAYFCYEIFLKKLQTLTKQINQQPIYQELINLFKQITSFIIIKDSAFSDYMRNTILLHDRHIKQIFVTQICDQFYRQNHSQPEHYDLFYDKLEEVFKNVKEKEAKQHIKQMFVDIYCRREEKMQSEQQIFDHFWKYMLDKPHLLNYVLMQFKDREVAILATLANKLACKQFSYEEIQKVKVNHDRYPEQIQTALPYAQISQSCKHIQKLIAAMKNLGGVFQTWQQLSQESKQINDIISQSNVQPINSLQEFMHRYRDFHEESQYIRVVMQTSQFHQHNVTDYASLITQYQRAKQLLADKIRGAERLSVTEFLQTFTSPTIFQIFEHHSQLQDILLEVKRISSLFTQDKLRMMHDTLSSLLYIKTILIPKTLTPAESEMKQKVGVALAIVANQSQTQTNIKDLFNEINGIKKIMDKKYGGWQEESKFRVIRAIQKHKALFQAMENLDLSQEKFKNLREYNNQIQNSFAKADIINQFKQVFQFWTILKEKPTSEGTLLQLIDRLMKDKNGNYGDIVRFIENCDSSKPMLLQKLQQSSDLSNSFKFEVLKILTSSHFVISQAENELDFKIVLYNGEDRSEFSFSKLSLYKEKSMLLFQSNQNTEAVQKIEQFQEFCKLVNEIQTIKQECTDLQSYGYDPKLLVTEIPIYSEKANDKIVRVQYRQIGYRRQHLLQLKQQWVKQVRQICSQSFILTHFIGPNLAIFVSTIIHGELPKIVNSILFSTQQFQLAKQTEENQSILTTLAQGNVQPIEKVKFVRKLFQSYDRPDMIDQRRLDANINLITSKKEYFYSHILRENNKQIPLPNQVFFCHEHTVSQQLEFFLYRALINNNNHFIIGVHKLSQKVKHQFCTLLKALKNEKAAQFNYARLFFIDNDDTNTVYLYLCKPKAFRIAKKLNYQNSLHEELELCNQKLVRLISQTQIISSIKPGLGKTHHVERYARSKNLKVHHFPIGGNINFNSLGKRLKQLEFIGKQVLLLKIGAIQQKQKLQIFLASLIILRCFFSEQYIYLHINTQIYIELQNIFEPSDLKEGKKKQNLHIDQRYYILNILFKNNFYHKIQRFQSADVDFQNSSKQQEFVFKCLQLFQSKQINNTNILLQQLKPQDYLPPHLKVELVQKYFAKSVRNNKQEPSYLLYTHAIKLLFNMFDTFTKSPFFTPELLESQNNHAPLSSFNYKQYRYNFLDACIKNSFKLLQQTFNENRFHQKQSKQKTFREMSKEYQMLIMPDYMKQTYRFVYFKDQSVPFTIKVFNIIQNTQTLKLIRYGTSKEQFNKVFAQHCSINKKKDQEINTMMHEILKATTCDERYSTLQFKSQMNNQFLSNYALTRDNFFKMCMIIQRERSNIPSIIEGESGVGKTALINYLSENFYKIKPLIFNIHAGIHQKQITQMVNKIIEESNQLYQLAMIDQSSAQYKKVFVFFDQFNTTDEVAYLKEIIIEHKYLGKSLPSNVYFIAACNPYRFKKVAKEFKTNGLQKNSISKPNQMAFTVIPPPLSMVQLMWDYQQLTKEQNKLYIQKILNRIQYPKKSALIEVMLIMHEEIKDKIEISAVSLRDVERFSQLYVWLIDYLEKKSIAYTGPNIRTRTQASDQQKSAAMALYFCYCLRFPSQQQRKQYVHKIQAILEWKDGFISRIVKQQQSSFTANLVQKSRNIAENSALKENIFTTFVCIMNKIPILIIGNPGSSKSLSVNILASNLLGTGSKTQICKKYPQINMIYFQGSESSTSKGVQQVFSRAQKFANTQKNCIYFDQIGLAEKSAHNPLKVLHSKLQIHGQRLVAFIGISNYELDAAKMSRFLILNRSPPSIEELRQTARYIYESYADRKKNSKLSHIIEQMGDTYSKFIQKWQEGHNNRKGFFGLRDFYNYVKHVCKNLKEDSYDLRQLIQKSIKVNFDGQRDSLRLFNQCFVEIYKREKYHNSDYFQKQINPVELVSENLKDNNSRCLLLIVKGEALLPIIEQSLSQEKIKLTMICGSVFSDDENSEEYNLQVTQKVISLMNKGEIAAFKDINNSIQSSLYDLFNKSYNTFGKKTYCRIAVGANSNPQCPVHQRFNAIVFMEENKARNLDLPFLNRFQKHYLQTQSILNDHEKNLAKKVQKWVNEQLLNQNILKGSVLLKQNYLFNTSQESIMTLVLRYRSTKNYQEKQRKIKQSIMNNRTLDFLLLYNQKNQENRHIIQQLQQMQQQQPEQDLIIYTYDQYIDLTQQRYMQIFGQSKKIRISEMKSEKQLKQQLSKHLAENYTSKCIVQIECSKLIQDNLKRQRQQNISKSLKQQKRHLLLIQQILFLSKKIKNQLNSRNQIIIIIQLQRSTFFKHQQFKINISYLHQFQQKFIEKFDTDPYQIIHNLSTFYDLFYKLELQENIKALYNRAALSMKIKVNDASIDPKNIFHSVINLDKNEELMRLINQFLQDCLRQHTFDVYLLHKDKQLLNLCSNTYEALERLTSKIATKYIFIFISTLTSGNYFKQFSEQTNMQTEEISRKKYKEKDLKMKQFSDELKQKVKEIAQRRQKLQQITLQKESNEVIFSSNQLLFKETRKFIQSIKQRINKYVWIDIEGAIQVKYQIFKDCFTQQLRSFSRIQENFKNEELKQLVMKDIITLKLIDKPAHQIGFMIDFFDRKVKASQLMKIFCLVGEKNRFIEVAFDILFISLRYCQKYQQLFRLIQQPKLLREQSSLSDQGKYFLEIIMKLTMQTVKVNRQNVEMFEGANSFYLHFKQINDKLTKSWDIISEFYEVPSQYFLLKGFYQLLEASANQSKEKTLNQFTNFESESSIYQRILHFVTNGMVEHQQLKQRYESFLSCNFFEKWASDCTKVHNYSSQIRNCIENFVEWSNKSVVFANKSEKFLSEVLPLQAQEIKITQISKAIKKSKTCAIIDDLLPQNLVFQLALNNYFCKKVIQIFHQARKIRNKRNVVLQQYYKDFQRIAQLEFAFVNTQNNFNIAFLKVYLNEYLIQLLNGQAREITQSIDSILQEDGTIPAHSRLFLTKNILNNLSPEEIKSNFFDCNRCEWIKYQKYIFQEKKSIRKVNITKFKALKQQIKRFQQSQMTEKEFKSLISKGLRNSETVFELLSYFLHQICYKFPQQQRKSLIKLINKSQELSHQDVKVVKTLLVCYAKGKIVNQLRNGKKSPYQCYLSQIHLCNYLNMIVSTQRERNPLAQMFFQGSKVQQSLSKYFKNRFCIGNLPHLGVAKLDFILKRHQNNFKARSYIKCSKDCDFFVPVGGNFYGVNDNCRNPIDIRRCPYCKSQIGGSSHYKVQLRPNNIHFEPQKLEEQINKLSSISYSYIFQEDKKVRLQLTGLVKCQNLSSLEQHFKRKANIIDSINQGFEQTSFVHQYILQSSIYFTYLFLLQSQLISENEIQRFFGLTKKDCLRLFPDFITYCQKQLEKELKITHYDLPFWSIAAGEQIFSRIIAFSNSVDPNNYKGLSSSHIRDLFQQQVKKALIVISYNAVQKQKAIKKKILIEQISFAQVLKQRVDYSKIEDDYQYIRLFKNMSDFSRETSEFDEAIYRYMKQSYSICIKNEYPLLNYFLEVYDKEKTINALQLIRNIKYILCFLTKIKKLCNLKIKRHEKKSVKLRDFVKRQLSREQSQKLLTQFKQYIKLWNNLRKNKELYNLQFDCHIYSNIPEINDGDCLNLFLPIEDQKEYNNTDAQSLTALISSFANIYNQVANNLKMIVKRVCPNSILAQDRQETLDPTEINSQSKLLQLPYQQYLKSVVSVFSSYSVQYGVCNLEFFFQEIQFALIKNMRPFCLLKQNKSDFRYTQFIGDKSHFLRDIKQRVDNLTLKDIKKFASIEGYFNDRKRGESDTFHKFVNEMQKSLEIILIYYKNANLCDSNCNLVEFIEKNRIPQIIKELKQQPFKKLQLKILVDLYQYVESLNFENIDKFLNQTYKHSITKNSQALENITEKMKKQKRPQGLPSYQNFKHALYRFVSRKILPETLSYNLKIKDQLCFHEYYWNKDEQTGKYIETFHEDLLKALDIPLENLSYLLKKVPFTEEISQAEESTFVKKTPNKRFL